MPPPTAIDSTAAFTALVALVQGLDDMQGTVYEGVPASFATAVGAYVVTLGMEITDKTTGNLLQMTQEFEVGFGYRVAGAPNNAERNVLAFKDAFVRAFYRDRTLGNAVLDGLIVPGLNVPDYRQWAGAEVRLYPIPVRVVQRETIT